MASSKHVYLMKDDGNGNKETVYPVTDVSAVIGMGDAQGDLLVRMEQLEERVAKLEKRANYY